MHFERSLSLTTNESDFGDAVVIPQMEKKQKRVYGIVVIIRDQDA